MKWVLHWLSLLLLISPAIAFPSHKILPLLTKKPLFEASQEPYPEGFPDARGGVPMRNDICRVLVTGVIGQDLKETYLSNDHYVINFPLAVYSTSDALTSYLIDEIVS